jgi:hypothetical protein
MYDVYYLWDSAAKHLICYELPAAARQLGFVSRNQLVGLPEPLFAASRFWLYLHFNDATSNRTGPSAQ